MENFFDFLESADLFSPGIIAILVGVGFVVGFVNTVAGMATAITYALFMAMGMPINIANGTTRVGVFAQFLVTSLIFKREGYLNLGTGVRVGIPVAAGALFGAELVAILSPAIIETAMGFLLPVMTLLLFLQRPTNNPVLKQFAPWKYFVFFLIGLYGGFTHAGVGLLIIFGSYFMLGMDMLHANGIKQFAVVIYTPIALAIFIIYGQVNWPVAVIYGVGNILGGVAGSYASIKGGVKIIKISVALAVLTMSGWLLYKNLIA